MKDERRPLDLRRDRAGGFASWRLSNRRRFSALITFSSQFRPAPRDLPRLLCRPARHERAREAAGARRRAAASGSRAAQVETPSRRRGGLPAGPQGASGNRRRRLDGARSAACGRRPRAGLRRRHPIGVRRFFAADPPATARIHRRRRRPWLRQAFASTGDTRREERLVRRDRPGLYAFTAEGDPNSGIIVGDDGCMVVDAQATPAMAKNVIERVARGHRQADPLRRADALSRRARARRLRLRRAGHRRLATRPTSSSPSAGRQDWDSEFGRFPRLFRDAESIPGLTWPTLTFESRDVGLPRPARGQAALPRRRPHGGRHRRLGSGRRGDVLGRSRRVPLRLLLRRRASARMAADPRRDPRLRAERAGARPRRCADRSGEGARGDRHDARLRDDALRRGRTLRRPRALA